MRLNVHYRRFVSHYIKTQQYNMNYFEVFRSFYFEVWQDVQEKHL